LRFRQELFSVASLLDYVNPTRFMRFSDKALPWLSGATFLLLGLGLFCVFFIVPPDYQQGETVRIMYIHVPSAWLSLFAYAVMTSAALGVLVWKHPLADAAQKTAASLGAAFTFICLVTGSLWGKPMWGTFWVWDARLTSMLVLFLLYLGLIAIRQTMDDTPRGARIASIMTIVGVIDIPIIKFSVDWWNTLHQPASVFRLGGPAIASSMLWPLLIMALGATMLFLTLHIMAIRNEILRRRVARLTIESVRADEAQALEAAE
jgi:heme exporter protein C